MNYFTKYKRKFISLMLLFIKCLMFYIASVVFLEGFLFSLSLVVNSDVYIAFRTIVSIIEFFGTAIFIIMIPIIFFCEVFDVSF